MVRCVAEGTAGGSVCRLRPRGRPRGPRSPANGWSRDHRRRLAFGARPRRPRHQHPGSLFLWLRRRRVRGGITLRPARASLRAGRGSRSAAHRSAEAGIERRLVASIGDSSPLPGATSDNSIYVEYGPEELSPPRRAFEEPIALAARAQTMAPKGAVDRTPRSTRSSPGARARSFAGSTTSDSASSCNSPSSRRGRKAPRAIGCSAHSALPSPSSRRTPTTCGCICVRATPGACPRPLALERGRVPRAGWMEWAR